MRRRNVRMLTTAAGDQIILPTSEENRSINEQIAGDPEDFELDDDWFEGAKPTSEVFPEAHEQALKRKADLEAGHIEPVLITLDQETINWFKFPDRRRWRHRRDRMDRAGRAGRAGPRLDG